MTRYVMLDNHSGYVWGDTADIGGKALEAGLGEAGMIAACRALDESLGTPGRGYEASFRLAANETGYRVYRVPSDFPSIADGQDEEAIESVEMGGEWIGCVRVLPEGD